MVRMRTVPLGAAKLDIENGYNSDRLLSTDQYASILGDRMGHSQVDLQFEARGVRDPWAPIERENLLLGIYEHAIHRSTRIRISGSDAWSARLWAEVMRNPYPKTARNPNDFSVRINPYTPRDFQRDVADHLRAVGTGMGLSVESEVSCSTALYRPRLDIAVFKEKDCKHIFECKWVFLLKEGEVLQAITYKALLRTDVTLVIPTKAGITPRALSMVVAADIPLLRFDDQEKAFRA